ncbi:MAG: type II toxin-antitoxin system RatA family toxin [Candidatus Accumulibacter sp.]|jgi:ribosome-associated toxin RatA of RatAB toxin-antitoxin module|nr:type II toxin-antitoxin system RatA family toxin [Accumulibacter sp.]
MRAAKVEKSVLIERSAKQMFDLVENIESYPKFLPCCGGTRVDYRDDKKTIATLYVDFLNIRSSLTTENEKDYPERMNLRLVRGPFRHLDGVWNFKRLTENACKVDFSLSYAFSSRVLEKLLAPMFETLADTFVEAFVKRANEVYGAANG